MELVQCLRVEHRVFLQELSFIEKWKKKVRSDGDVRGLRQVVFCIADAVHKHSRIEEKYLFPKLRPYLGREMSSVAVMEFEHGEIRKIIEILRKDDRPGTILLEASKFTAFLRDHLAKEERVLFPVAEKVLGEKELRVLARKAGYRRARSWLC
ncbi:MAG: hemerythrin domain-containing protein [Candidatus Omnitrophica bacterium]|nr:hemerythrin domain-containing protein [Candidatus Omnitrophota bacterium]